MEQLIKTIDELRSDVKQLHSDMNKGKGVIAFLVIIGGLATAIVSFFQFR